MLRRFCLTIYLIYIANGIFLQCQVSALNIEKECQPATIDGDCSDCGKCLPGLKCNEAKKCKIDTGTCNSYQWTNDKWKPKCEEDGSFSPWQCKGEYSNGRCIPTFLYTIIDSTRKKSYAVFGAP